MDIIYLVNLIFIIAVNVLFFFAGICLNSLVILSFLRSAQLRKKLCYFTIMLLSGCDLLVALTNHPAAPLATMSWLIGKLNAYPGWLYMFCELSSTFVLFSSLALLVMNFDRYLSTSYPIFHRTTVTKGKLLTFFAVLLTVEITLAVISTNDFVISYEVGLLLLFPPMLFFNYKLFTVVRKTRRNNGMSAQLKKSFSLKNVSSCLLAVASFVVILIPAFIYLGMRMTSKEKKPTLDIAEIIGLWSQTIYSMNCTFNCLIFYWKDKILRNEGMKVIKGIKIWR